STPGDGGGVLLSGECVGIGIVNSTISSNRATGSGGGIYAATTGCSEGGFILDSVTIAENVADAVDGGGIFTAFGFERKQLQVSSSIIADNANNGDQAPDCGGVGIQSMGYNLIQNASGCEITGDATGNLLGVAAGLAPLQDNGGPTL